MAELNVQPKKKPSYLPWILLVLGALALAWFLTRNKDVDVADTATARDSLVAPVPETTTAVTPVVTAGNTDNQDWNSIDFDAPAAQYDEVTDRNINVRSKENYGIYGIGENILFDEGKASIRKDAEANLKQVIASIDKRYKAGAVRVYGYTDSKGDADQNKQLAQQRADAVKAWLEKNGIDAGRISLNAIGESHPVASNSTEAGRKQNRRVEIVARTTGS